MGSEWEVACLVVGTHTEERRVTSGWKNPRGKVGGMCSVLAHLHDEVTLGSISTMPKKKKEIKEKEGLFQRTIMAPC